MTILVDFDNCTGSIRNAGQDDQLSTYVVPRDAGNVELADKLSLLLETVAEIKRSAYEATIYSTVIAIEHHSGLNLPAPDLISSVDWRLSREGDLTIEVGHGVLPEPEVWRHGQLAPAGTPSIAP